MHMGVTVRVMVLTPLSTIFQLYLTEETGVPGENHQPATSH